MRITFNIRTRNRLSRMASAMVLLGALMLPFISSNAYAQISGTISQWAVLDFANNSKFGGNEVGGTASDAVATLLAGTNRANIVPRETVDRAYRDLQFTPPVTRQLDVLRMAQYLQVDTIFTGEVSQVRINNGGRGKSADVVLIIRGIDTYSGMALMGAAVVGQSSERPGDVSDEAVVNEALDYAAQQAVSKILMQQLGFATIIATPGNSLRLNKGSRDGMKKDMELVVTRGREQVAVIKITQTDNDISEAVVVRSIKGVAPGDKARPIFDKLDRIDLTPRGPRVRTTKKMDTSGALVGLLVVGLAATLVGKEGQNVGAGRLITEATLNTQNQPAVYCSWTPNMFSGSFSERIEWQIWRDDIFANPAFVAPPEATWFYNSIGGFAGTWRVIDAVYGSGECLDDPGGTDFAATGVIPGTSYMYKIRLVFRVSALSVPGGDQTDNEFCYFRTGDEFAIGRATPMSQVVPVFPENFATDVDNNVQFSWFAVANADEYAIEISTQPNFQNKNQMVVVARKVTNPQPPGTEIGLDAPVDISGIFPGVQQLYWRVGARNSGDNPGPTLDPLGERYVFGTVYQFTRVEEPPPPPGPQKGISTPPGKVGDRNPKSPPSKGGGNPIRK